MRFRQRFERRIATSRRHVFENILDLDHVCVLHRRWFRNLRIVAWRPDYVEYRLTSRFFGLRQEIDVRGAPVDEDRYWYEFNGPLARIRVDGEMRGPDGDLTLAETITFRHHWLLAPVFFALRPLFARQKLDILRDDTALLERVHRLDQQGFRRHASEAPRVVVYGGSGFFGRCVVEDLLAHTNAQLGIASRRPHDWGVGSAGGRVRFHVCDYRDREAASALIRGARVVVNCAGPYQGMPLDLLETCIRERVHYVDVADDRDYFERACSLAPAIERAGIIAFVGCSVVPGLSVLLAERCRQELEGLDDVHVAITPGTRFTRGPGSFECLLATVGRTFDLRRDGERRPVIGWSEAERVEFPSPIGIRTVYSVVDVPDYVVHATLFGAGTIDFKIGSELAWLNRSLSVVREATRRLRLTDLRGFVPLFRAFLHVASRTGTSRGAVRVAATRRSGGVKRSLALSVFREVDGHVIPAVVPSLAVSRILDGRLAFRGLADLRSWISFEDLVAELRARSILVARHDHGWHVLGTSGMNVDAAADVSASRATAR